MSKKTHLTSLNIQGDRNIKVAHKTIETLSRTIGGIETAIPVCIFLKCAHFQRKLCMILYNLSQSEYNLKHLFVAGWGYSLVV